MEKPFFLCVIGIDGSGKTTLTQNVLDELQYKGISAEYRWCKFESTLLKIIIYLKNLLIIREKDWKKNYNNSLKLKKNLFKNTTVNWFYENYVFLSYSFQILYKIKFPLMTGKNIVCDRYIYDTIVDLNFDLHYNKKSIISKINQFFKFAPMPDVLFFVEIPEEVAFKRKNDVPSLEFLEIKKKTYCNIINYLDTKDSNLIILNGQDSKNNLKKDVIERMKEMRLINE